MDLNPAKSSSEPVSKPGKCRKYFTGLLWSLEFHIAHHFAVSVFEYDFSCLLMWTLRYNSNA